MIISHIFKFYICYLLIICTDNSVSVHLLSSVMYLDCVSQQMLLSDFTHHHIEMACTLLETCGRFLFRSPDSHLRTSVLLVR